jgi:UDP-N-acetylmuramoylalanine-D-glutamate ligase
MGYGHVLFNKKAAVAGLGESGYSCFALLFSAELTVRADKIFCLVRVP